MIRAFRYVSSFPTFVTPESMGAVGDGSTDDSAAFVRALADGRPLLLDATKIYAVKGITISSGCPGIYSTGARAQIVPASGSTSSTILFTVNKDDFTFENIYFNLPISTTAGSPPACDRAVYFNATQRGSVIDCYFVGGKYGPYFGGVCKYFICKGNRVTQVWGQAISADSPYTGEITHNEMWSGGYDGGASSGAIRIGGIASQNAVIEDVSISDNIIRDWNVNVGQEAIDVSCQAARNLLVANNIMDGCGNGGLELKTGPSSLSPDIYQNVMITGNVVRMLTTAGIGFDLHFATADTPSKESKITVSNNRVYCDSQPSSGTAYGIIVTALEDVAIIGNDISNVLRGIIVGPDGVSTTNTTSRVQVMGNTVLSYSYALQLQGAGTTPTINDILIQGNRLVATNDVALSAAAPAVNRAIIQNNYIESQSGTAAELRGLDASRVCDNDMVAAGSGNCILTQSTPAAGAIKIYNNRLSSPSGHALNLGTGSGILVFDNKVDVSSTHYTATGAGTFTTVGNFRGSAASSPASTLAACIGDYWMNDFSSSTTTLKWVAVTTGTATNWTAKAVALS